jgi:flavin-dependent dehydrogenase
MAGLALARAGVSAVIVEKERFPRRKACGGLLSPKSVEIIEREIGRGRTAPMVMAATAFPPSRPVDFGRK